MVKLPGKARPKRQALAERNFNKARNIDYIGSTPIKCARAKVLAIIKLRQDGDFRP